MRIWIDIPDGPPTWTAQQRRWSVRGGKPVTYPDKRAKATKEMLTALLAPHAPKTPYSGPVRLDVSLVYPYRKTEKRKVTEAAQMIPKVTRPDVDNQLKLLQDCMTNLGFWTDDSIITDLHASKYWGANPGIEIIVEPVGDDLTGSK